MLTTEAVIVTDHAEQYLARLGKHMSKLGDAGRGHRLRAHGGGDASHHVPPRVEHTEWSATSGTVRLDWGGWTAEADPRTLRLRAEAADEASLRRIQDMLTTRLEKFGRREHLTVTWQAAA
jgi:hypothetical protein